ncbi:hypothetical protein GGR56DRAFT_34893 [Xylariaceae sp. FL0804]|nr:hypothetical protein GGR56DRAFT_34893 [Xylariaceae sp. FL0804]
MLQYFTARKGKKQQEATVDKKQPEKEQAATAKSTKQDTAADKPEPSSSPVVVSKPKPKASDEGTPLLDPEDEKFLERLTSPELASHDDDEDEGPPPPLPPRVKTPVIELDSDDSSVASKDDKPAGAKGGKAGDKGKGKSTTTEDPKEKPPNNKRFSFVTNMARSISVRRKPSAAGQGKKPADADLKPERLAVPEPEVDREQDDMTRVLNDLDLSARNNRAFSLSAESADMVRRFTQVLRDLANGVPTAYGDLVGLLEDRDGAIARSYEKLPRSLKKLVAQLPEKLTGSLAPELLAVAAEAQGLKMASEEGAAADAGVKAAAKRLLTPGNLKELVTKPGAVAGLLKGIVNALKTRWPAFMGTNVLWSVAVFLLLSMLWYCHKRGREVRLEGEEAAAQAALGKRDDGKDPIDGAVRVEELPDDPQLPAPVPAPAGSALPPAEAGSSRAGEDAVKKATAPVPAAAPAK